MSSSTTLAMHGPELPALLDAPIECVYRGHYTDVAGQLTGFAPSAYGYGYLAVLMLHGIQTSVPMRRVEFPAWLAEA